MCFCCDPWGERKQHPHFRGAEIYEFGLEEQTVSGWWQGRDEEDSAQWYLIRWCWCATVPNPGKPNLTQYFVFFSRSRVFLWPAWQPSWGRWRIATTAITSTLSKPSRTSSWVSLAGEWPQHHHHAQLCSFLCWFLGWSNPQHRLLLPEFLGIFSSRPCWALRVDCWLSRARGQRLWHWGKTVFNGLKKKKYWFESGSTRGNEDGKEKPFFPCLALTLCPCALDLI